MASGTAHAFVDVTTTSQARYAIASIAVLVAVVGVYAVSTARRTQAELETQLEQKALALADAVVAASANAVRSNELVERMITERLLDNARLIDALVARPMPPGTLDALVRGNGLRRVDLLDADGAPWTPPAPPFGMPGMGPRLGRPMTPFLWGPRWRRAPDTDGATPGADSAAPPPAVKDRRFWEGSVFGVATGATSFRGIIAVHADADYVLNFRREIGIDRLLRDFGRQSGVMGASLLAPDFLVLADADPARVGRRVDDAALRVLAAGSGVTSRVVDGARFEVLRPLALHDGRTGVLVVAFSTEPMARMRAQDLRAGAIVGGAALLVGGAGLALIFRVQQRHLAEFRRLQAEMAKRERLAALGDVAAAFAHEVRNPLNAVSMGLQRLRTEWAPEPRAEHARFVGVLEDEVRRLNAIVEQFLTLSRPLPLAPAPVDARALLDELAEMLEPEAKTADVEIRVTGTLARPLVADRDALKQVMLNVALNGLRAMPDGGVLTLDVSGSRDGVALSVGDTGDGIAADVLPRIFDPYFSTRGDGLGLGLTIARRIVDAHGGAIDAESAPGQGARFRVALPWRPS